MELIKRCFNEPAKSYFLFGPRGTGKSTYLKTHYTDQAIWINLLQPEIHRSYSARPERLDEIIVAQPKKSIIIIDEIQKVPNLLAVVHRWIEEKKGLKFILTGSSARKLKRTGADLLAGRALRYTLHPFMASELNEKFSLDRALQYGLLPLVYFDPCPRETLQAYIHLYLQEEIHGAALEGLVAQHLRAWIDYNRDKKHSLSFWRTRSGLEVDFIIYGETHFFAIEVKNAKKIGSTDTKALEAFLSDYPEAQALLLYRGNEYIKLKNVLCVPCEDFLKKLKPDHPFWH